MFYNIASVTRFLGFFTRSRFVNSHKKTSPFAVKNAVKGIFYPHASSRSLVKLQTLRIQDTKKPPQRRYFVSWSGRRDWLDFLLKNLRLCVGFFRRYSRLAKPPCRTRFLLVFEPYCTQSTNAKKPPKMVASFVCGRVYGTF